MRNASPIAFVPLFFLGLSASGGMISTSISCGITNNDPRHHLGQTQTSTSSCGVTDPNASEPLFSMGSVSTGPFFTSIQGQESAGSGFSDGSYFWSDFAGLDATASYTATILTDGRFGMVSSK